MATSVLVAFVCLCAWVILKLRNSLAAASRRKLGAAPPKVISWLPLGIDLAPVALYHLANHSFLDWTQSLIRRYGHTFEMELLGKRLIITDDPENIKAIQYTQFSDYPKGELLHRIFHTVLGDSVFATDGKLWHANKRQLSPYLNRAREEELDLTESEVKGAIETMSSAQVVDVYDLMDRYQFDVMRSVFMGTSSKSVAICARSFRQAIETLLRVNGFRQLFGELGVYISENILCPSAIKTLDDVLKQLVDHTLSQPVEKIESKSVSQRNLVESLAVQREPRKVIKSQLIALLLAGKDPVSIVISWAIYELARNPEVYESVVQEVRSTFTAGERPTLAQIKAMPTVGAVVNETMRVYHPLGMNLRSPPQNTTLPRGGGELGDQPIGILSGTQIVYSVISLQRRTDCGSHPEQWRPQRWKNWTPKTWDFIPFNHGPRICLGRNYATMQLEYAIVRIAHEFSRIELKEGPPQKLKLELNTKMAHPILCSFHR